MKVFLIAGEPSGDKLGGALMAGLKQLVPDIVFSGVGGPQMQAEGLVSQFPMEELSVMGLAEVLPKYRHLKRRIRETAEAVLADPPDVMITIDSPDFCLRVARLVKAASSLRTVHYVAPTVWAWRPKRAEKMARVIDHVLALFPFEPPYMQAAGMDCDFVGHPVATEPAVSAAERAAFIAKYNVMSGAMVMLPGSRRSEVERLGATLSAAVAQSGFDGQVILPTLPHLRDVLQSQIRFDPARRVIVDGAGLRPAEAARERLVAMAVADTALAASGTVSLELAAADTPMIIAYDMNWLSRKIIARKLLIDTVTLVNLVSETRDVPEFIGDACRPGAIATALRELRADPSAQQASLRLTMERLGRGGEAPGLRAARAVLSRM